MRARLRIWGACALLAAASVVSRASADDAPLPPVARFADETPESPAVVALNGPTDVRDAPSDAGRIVARLAAGALVTRLAWRRDAVLIEIEDPEGAHDPVVGWVPARSLPPWGRGSAAAHFDEAVEPKSPTLAPLLRNGELGASPATATATPSATPPATSTATHEGPRTWYGWQILISDGAALSLGIGAAVAYGENRESQGAAVLAMLGLFTYEMAPLIHWAHGNVGGGAGSLALRLIAGSLALMPIAFFMWGGPGELAGVAGGLLLVPTSIDIARFAFAPVPATSKPAARLMPTLAPTKNGATLGLGGTF